VGTHISLRPLRFAAALLLAAGAALAVQPTRTTIVLDGDFDDWQTVFANPSNSVFDGDGSSIPCGRSTDRDCIVPVQASDIRAYAFTWDDTNLYLYVERFDVSNSKSYMLYLDLDYNAVFDATDLVLAHGFKASLSTIQRERRYYVPLNPAGDPTVDALGFGDGYTPPGSVGPDVAGPTDPPDCPSCASPDDLRFEFAWPWAVLGVPPGAAVRLHLSSGNSANAPGDDNVAGALGKAGGTGFALHSLDAPIATSAPPRGSAFLPHRIENLGNLPDIIGLRVLSSLGEEVCFYEDPAGDGTPGALLACDHKGNGDFTDQGDYLAPGADSDGDTRLDTGTLLPWETFRFVGEVRFGNPAGGSVERTTFQTNSAVDPLVTDSVRDEISVGDISVIIALDKRAAPGSVLRLAHTARSHLPAAVTIDIEVESVLGWSYTLYSDPDGDGDPSDGTALFDTTGDTYPDIGLTADGSYTFVVEATVPPGALVGSEEYVTLRFSSGSLRTHVVDRVVVVDTLSVAPDYTLSGGTLKAGSPNYPVFFRHSIVWSGEAPESFQLTALSSQGFPVTFYSDPNGDGNPADGVLLREPVVTPSLEAYGGTFPFLVRISIPEGAAPGTVDTTSVYAVALSSPLIFDQATDETRVNLVQTFDDTEYVEVTTHASLCSTVYARASGLAPSQDFLYRIEWQDPGGATFRVKDVASDARGEAFASIDLLPSHPLGLWSVAIQELQGGVWVDLDRWFFEAENRGAMDALYSLQDEYSLLDRAFSATAIFRNNGLSDLTNLRISFLVRTPGGGTYLRGNGQWAVYTGGASQTTFELGNLDLLAGDSHLEPWTISDLGWPMGGTYTLDAWWESQCGETIGSASALFRVVEDGDQDGLRDDVEEQNGLDPTDRDSDDDGIPDGEDGIGDADGDTVVDGLECDADADTLPDSVEAGLDGSGLDPHTDLSAGCFRADADAGATTTARLDPDTDDGGEPDGTEDMDRDGLIDPGEKNPRDPSDDPCGWGPPPEVRDLLLARAGPDIGLVWSDLSASDPCVAYDVLWASDVVPSDPSVFTEITGGLSTPSFLHSGAVGSGALAHYLVVPTTPFGGGGPLGHFGR
jgi:hypothetical protein